MKIAAEITVEGQVQGVGYRWFAERRARELNISGTVENVDNGHVLIRAEGKKADIEELILSLWAGPSFAKVTNVRTIWNPYSGRFSEFQIIH